MRSVDEIRSRVADISTSDLTERVPVPESRDEIAALAVTMNEMLARIEAGHAAQQRFVGDASHELRSPLTTIISALEVAVAHPELLDADLAAGTLMPEAQRMKALIDDLLLLARADERGLTMATRRRRPRRPRDGGGPTAATGDVSRRCAPTSAPPGSSVTPTRCRRVLRNLFDNAARHAASRVEVEVRPAATACSPVGDDGPGIPPGDRVRVFDRFVRLDPDRVPQRGRHRPRPGDRAGDRCRARRHRGDRGSAQAAARWSTFSCRWRTAPDSSR